MPNQLANQSSPYLLQHKDNPVDWHPWGQEALERAKAEGKPIFLSIGYSACHWCHVMEHESFENKEIARQLNESFVSIKVDREERPDLDQIYMQAVQILTGRGGWPMSVFLTPEGEPFYGGTYWPPTSRQGMPGFDQILGAVREAWSERRERATETAAELTERIRDAGAPPTVGQPSRAQFDAAAAALERSFDFRHGGFGGAPKFPHTMDLEVLLRYWRRHPREDVLHMVKLSLDKMAGGGIYDHLGGGFARYSVDARWLVPHFEKMLYDNALLAVTYLNSYRVTRDRRYAQVVRETLDYVLRDMTDPAGGFYSSEDADSEGVEGKFYVWTPDEVRQVLGTEAAETFASVYDVTDQGNFEGQNILNLPKTIEQCAKFLQRDLHELEAELAAGREKLLAARDQRVRPGRDDKVIVCWNALMIDAMAQAAGVLDEPRFSVAATQAADFLLENLLREDGRLLHTWRGGQAKLDAYLDDYAAIVNALVSLYEASFEERFLDEAVRLADLMLDLFGDPEGGAFFYTARDHETLIARSKDLMDNAVPCGNSLAATGLLRLGKLCGRSDYLDAAAAILTAATGVIERAPAAAGQMLQALDRYLGPSSEIAILGDADHGETAAVLRDLRRRFLPNQVVALRSAGSTADHSTADTSAALDPLFVGKSSGEQPTVYVCENFACQAPISGQAAVLEAWEKLSGSDA